MSGVSEQEYGGVWAGCALGPYQPAACDITSDSLGAHASARKLQKYHCCPGTGVQVVDLYAFCGWVCGSWALTSGISYESSDYPGMASAFPCST